MLILIISAIGLIVNILRLLFGYEQVPLRVQKKLDELFALTDKLQLEATHRGYRRTTINSTELVALMGSWASEGDE